MEKFTSGYAVIFAVTARKMWRNLKITFKRHCRVNEALRCLRLNFPKGKNYFFPFLRGNSQNIKLNILK